ncbi:hypothetical protein ACFQJD_13070 [Haloplanus sp. GCM10025708]
MTTTHPVVHARVHPADAELGTTVPDARRGASERTDERARRVRRGN